MPLPNSLLGDRWTEYTARRIMPLLVWCAQQGQRINYGQLDAELQRRGWGHHVLPIQYGHPAGAVGNAISETAREIGERIPPLNALVVNKRSLIPGSGCDYYLATHLHKRPRGNLSDEQRKSMAEDTMEDVWRFPKWSEILNHYGLRPIRGGIPSLLSKACWPKPRRSGWSSVPESKEHQALKQWVSQNPQILRSSIPFHRGRVEWTFASADCVDVLFAHHDGCAAVEVKAVNANDAEIERGIYQCVKYQALLRAELKAECKIPNGSAILVTERHLPSQLQETGRPAPCSRYHDHAARTLMGPSS